MKHFKYYTVVIIFLFYFILSHTGRTIYNSQSQGLKWPKDSKKRREEFTRIEEGFN